MRQLAVQKLDRNDSTLKLLFSRESRMISFSSEVRKKKINRCSMQCRILFWVLSFCCCVVWILEL